MTLSVKCLLGMNHWLGEIPEAAPDQGFKKGLSDGGTASDTPMLNTFLMSEFGETAPDNFCNFPKPTI